MKIDILTLFPEMFKGPFGSSIIKRAQENKLVEIKIHNLRDWAKDNHKTVDDRPYGGGTGMILKIKPIYLALKDLKSKTVPSRKKSLYHKSKIILLDPGGPPFTQKKARNLSKLKHLILIAGHYEGVDHRIREHLIDEEISIGDYILTGGEIPAMAVTDSIIRLIPGVLEKQATENESFSNYQPQQPNKLPTTNNLSLLEHPQYTRPETFRGWKVPKILLSGNHKAIEKWKQKKSLERTKKNRPDLVRTQNLSFCQVNTVGYQPTDEAVKRKTKPRPISPR